MIPYRGENGKLPDATALGHIVELLIYCVGHHGYRVKYYVLRVNMAAKILHLINRREKWLVVAALRFVKACVTTKDEFFHKYLVRAWRRNDTPLGCSLCFVVHDVYGMFLSSPCEQEQIKRWRCVVMGGYRVEFLTSTS